MADLAIAISVFDRFDDVRLLVDIFRKNWQRPVRIVVCSSHPDPAPHLAGCDIDALLVTENIPFDPATATMRDRQILMSLRVLDSIRKACGRCSESDAPYTLHVHADAVPLSEADVFQLIDEMRSRGKVFAARGYGFGFYVHDAPLGEFDDMFFVFDNAFARASRLWEFSLADVLPHKVSVHGWLAMLALSKAGIRRFYHYARNEDAQHWDGKPPMLAPLNAAHPMYFDPRYGFLHLHERAFPGDLGPRLKAHYLAAHNISKGAAVEAILAKWQPTLPALFDELRALDQKYVAFFRRRGLASRLRHAYGRDFQKLERLLTDYRNASPIGKLRWLMREHVAQARNAARRWYDRRRPRGEAYSIIYRDNIWPASVDRVYAAAMGPAVLALPDFAGVRFDLDDSASSRPGPRPS